MHPRMSIFGPCPTVLLVFALLRFHYYATGAREHAGQRSQPRAFDLAQAQHFRAVIVHHFHMRGAFSTSRIRLARLRPHFSAAGRPSGDQA